MTQLVDFVRLQIVSGDPVTIGDVKVTPQSQAFTVQLPFGGFVWNRPVAVLVERKGETRRIPIFDLTRLIQIGLVVLTIIFARKLIPRQRRHQHG